MECVSLEYYVNKPLETGGQGLYQDTTVRSGPWGVIGVLCLHQEGS